MSQKANKNNADMNFEIQFYEGIIRERPNFTEALMALGDLYTKRGLCKQGLEIDVRLSKLKPDDPLILYNLTCSYSLTKDVDKALTTIKQAIACGYNDLEYLKHDEDLHNLRQDSRFQELLFKIEKKSNA